MKQAALLVAAGLPGLAALALALPDVPGVPRWALLVNPALLLVLASCAGAWAAPRCGLALRVPGIATRARLSQAALGAALGVALALADHAGRSWWQPAPGLPPSVVEGWRPSALLLGVFYGGVVEEILLRWGLMSLLLLALWRGLFRRAASPPRAALAAAVALSALAFAAAHLPAVAAALPEPGAGVVLRTLLLNAVAGLVFGWLFARRDLVAAMAAHAAAHLGFAAAGLAWGG